MSRADARASPLPVSAPRPQTRQEHVPQGGGILANLAPRAGDADEDDRRQRAIAAQAMGDAAGAEVQFAGEVPLESQVYWWHDKYRPRKPKYFNRVHTGYEWNKYNQTHYDHDNPPPKVVQGYKFNIFYPDLIDKTKAPRYEVLPDGSEHGETCILRFIAGPPYEARWDRGGGAKERRRLAATHALRLRLHPAGCLTRTRDERGERRTVAAPDPFSPLRSLLRGRFGPARPRRTSPSRSSASRGSTLPSAGSAAALTEGSCTCISTSRGRATAGRRRTGWGRARAGAGSCWCSFAGGDAGAEEAGGDVVGVLAADGAAGRSHACINARRRADGDFIILRRRRPPQRAEDQRVDDDEAGARRPAAS